MNYKEYNDYELVYMVRENDDECTNILYDKYISILKKIAYDYYQKFNTYGYDYDDFLQEAFISFQKALVSFDESKNSLFYSFVVLCVRRNLMSFCRNISSKKSNLSNYYLLNIEDVSIIDSDSDIMKNIHQLEIYNIFLDFIFEFSLEVSSIMELRINGFSYREISSLLDIPSSSVEFKSRKARKRLQQKLREYKL